MFHSVINFISNNPCEVMLFTLTSVFGYLLFMMIISAGEDN
jgi:hypothetical protein